MQRSLAVPLAVGLAKITDSRKADNEVRLRKGEVLSFRAKNSARSGHKRIRRCMEIQRRLEIDNDFQLITNSDNQCLR